MDLFVNGSVVGSCYNQ